MTMTAVDNRRNNKPPAPSNETVSKYVGSTFLYREDSLYFAVDVTEVRNRFGHIDARITPVAGSGAKWVQASRLQR